MHVTEFLKKPDVGRDVSVIALFGRERHLKHFAVQRIAEVVFAAGDETDAGLGLIQLAGNNIDLRTVCDELRTISMWSDRRIVVITGADEFVSDNRAGLERYLEAPSKKAILVLEVNAWPKSTRLAKRVAQIGLTLECSELQGAALYRWLAETAEQHGKKLSRDAAVMMVELAGAQLGLLDQELAKLVSWVGDREAVTPEDVRTLVGGWKAETTWTMLNAVRDDDLSTALSCLDKLLVAGEPPQKILGGMNFIFRRFAHATEYSRQGISLKSALGKAGLYPRDIEPTARYLRRVGRPHAERIYHVLLTADRRLKGGSRVSERLQLEQLLVELSGRIT